MLVDSVCKKFMQNEVEIFVDENKLIHGLTQYYAYIQEGKKFEKLCHLLDELTINQVIIFVNKVERAMKLTELLTQRMFNPICVHRRVSQEDRIKNYEMFKSNQSKLLVTTDVFGRGIDIERVNLVINYGRSGIDGRLPQRQGHLPSQGGTSWTFRNQGPHYQFRPNRRRGV